MPSILCFTETNIIFFRSIDQAYMTLTLSDLIYYLL